MTYAEALQILSDPTLSANLRQRVRIAVLVSADVVRAEAGATTNHAARLAWAKGVYANPDLAAQSMLAAVVAQNIGVTQSVALNAGDAAVQTNCNAAIDVLT